jgi:D-aspartate ligase
MQVETPVVVLRLDHYGALGMMRSLGSIGVTVYGMHRSRDALALRSRHCKGAFIWDLDLEPADDSIEYLHRIANSLGVRPLLISTNDETALFIADNAARLRTHFTFQENGAELVRTLYDKRSMHFLAKQLDIPTAQTAFPASREDANAFAATAVFPVVLKASDGIRVSGRAGTKTVIARSADELVEWYDRLADPAHPDLMLQEYIPGGEDAQWMFNGYFDEHSNCLFGVTGRKLRQTPVYTGMTSLGECFPNEEVDRITREFMKAIGYRGILDIGYRYDARDGAYKVLDVNPRAGATFRLFVGHDGMDVVRALYLDLTGQEVPPSRIRRGRRWFVEDLDLISSIRYRQDGVLGVREWIRSFKGVEEGAWFSLSDPYPFMAMAGRFLAHVVRKSRASIGKRLCRPKDGVAQIGDHGTLVAQHFAHAAEYWKRIYEEDSLLPMIYRARRGRALEWVDAICLPKPSRVLEVGCGAGATTVALAERGYEVHAIDSTPEMIALTEDAARAARTETVTASVGDVHELAYSESQFDLVVALGVLPWLASVGGGLSEMARVLRPGGYLITTADNDVSLSRLLDPLSTPLLSGQRLALKRALTRLGLPLHREPLVTHRHHPSAVDQLIRSVGLEKVESATVGFGPFCLFGHGLFPARVEIRLQTALQRLAEKNWPLLHSTGSHYLILAQKPSA